MATDNLAFDLELFDNNARKSSAAPKREAPARPRALPEKPRTRTQLKKEARYSRREAFKIILVSLMLFLILGSSVFCRAVVMDLESEKEALQTTISEARSENVRLRSTVESMYSIDNISAYAEGTLGMLKKDSYQINYFEID